MVRWEENQEVMISWKCNEKPYTGKKRGTSVSNVADRPNKRRAGISPLDLAMCRLLVNLVSSFGGVGSRED